jgi:hypothetical protein
MTNAAFSAVVRERLRADRRAIAFACAAAAIVGFIQPHGIATVTDPLGADFATRSVWLAGPIFFCSTIGIALAMLQGPGRHAYLDTTERSAPLFGRELARAKAVPPVAASVLTALTYWAAQYLTGFAAPPTFFGLALACVVACTLVALNATVREGAVRLVPFALAAVTMAIAYVLAVYADGFSTRRGDAVGVATELGFCAIVGYFALKEYGESLARFDVLGSR